MTRQLLGAVVVCLALFGVPSAGVAQTAPSVSAQDEQFSPPTTRIAAGTAVTWSNDGGEQHTMTADDNSFDSGPVDPGQTYQYAFTTPGTYNYYCSFHGGPGGQGMAGVIVVS